MRLAAPRWTHNAHHSRPWRAIALRTRAQSWASSSNDRDRRQLTDQISSSLQFISAVRRSEEVEQRIKTLSLDLEKTDPSNAHAYGTVARNLAEAQRTVRDLERWRRDLKDWTELASERDAGMADEALAALRALLAELKTAELAAAMNGEDDEGPCFVEVRAGAGGTARGSGHSGKPYAEADV